MRTINAKFKEGVEGGLTGRPMEIVIEIDNEQVWDQLAVKAAAVKVQAKTRKKQQGWSWEEVNGKTIKVSEIMARTVATVVTPENAVKVFSSQDIATKIEMLYDLGMNTDGIVGYFDHQLEKGGVTQAQYDEAVDLLSMDD